MKTIEITPVHVVFIPEIQDMAEGHVYISLKYHGSGHLCLCGCKKQVYLPLTPQGWVLTESAGKITITPSVGNYNYPCQSHYVITDNKVNFI